MPTTRSKDKQEMVDDENQQHPEDISSEEEEVEVEVPPTLNEDDDEDSSEDPEFDFDIDQEDDDDEDLYDILSSVFMSEDGDNICTVLMDIKDTMDTHNKILMKMLVHMSSSKKSKQ